MYGLCEIHKDTTVNDPLSLFQPILSAIGTTLVVLGLQVVLTTLENLLHQYLKQFTINEFTVKDSFSFCEEILDQNPNLFMASFDIQSLFTNIPLDETIDIQVDLVFRKKKRKLKACLSDISNKYFLLSHRVFSLMIIVIKKLKVQPWVLHWDQQITREKHSNNKISFLDIWQE